MDIPPCIWSRDPSAFTGCHGGSTIKAHPYFASDQRPSGLHALDEARVKVCGFIREKSGLGFYAGF
jgi:hypothetical protein